MTRKNLDYDWQPIADAPKGEELVLYHPPEEGKNSMRRYVAIGVYPASWPRKPSHFLRLPPDPAS